MTNWNKTAIARLLRFGSKNSGGWDEPDICEVEGLPDEADAALVAAAPDLLDACREALDFCKIHGPVGCTPDTAALVAQRLTTAIMKAEGLTNECS